MIFGDGSVRGLLETGLGLRQKLSWSGTVDYIIVSESYKSLNMFSPKNLSY